MGAPGSEDFVGAPGSESGINDLRVLFREAATSKRRKG